MGNLAIGSIMVFFVLIVTAVVALLQDGLTPTGEDVGCDSDGNTTTCNGSSPSNFLDSFFDVSVSGIEGANPVFNGFYLIVMVGILVIGFGLIVAGIIGTPLGGG